MHMTLFRACPRACLAADTVLRIGYRHDFVAHVVTELILAFKGLLDEFEDISAAGFIAPAASDTFMDIDGLDEFRHPNFAAPGIPYYVCHI